MEGLDRSFEVFALDEPHRIERPAPVVSTQAVDRNDTRVLQPPGDLHLQQEPLAKFRVVGEPVLKLLQGHLPVQLQIERDADPPDPAIGMVAQHAKPWIMGQRCRRDPVRLGARQSITEVVVVPPTYNSVANEPAGPAKLRSMTSTRSGKRRRYPSRSGRSPSRPRNSRSTIRSSSKSRAACSPVAPAR